jgi:hypothetical protein
MNRVRPIRGRLSPPVTVNEKTRQWDYQNGAWLDEKPTHKKPKTTNGGEKRHGDAP